MIERSKLLKKKNLSEIFFLISLFFLSLSIFLSVTILPLFQIAFIISSVFCCLENPKQHIKKLPLSGIALCCFVLIHFVSFFINFDHIKNLSHSFSNFKYSFIGILGLYIFQNIKISEKNFKYIKISFFSFMMSIIIAFFYSAICQYYNFDFIKKKKIIQFRFSGFTDIMRYGYGSAIIVLFFIPLLLNFKKINLDQFVKKQLLFITTVIAFLGVYFSYTRGALLGILCALPISLFFFHQKLGKIIGIFSGLIITGLIVVSLFFHINGNRFFQNAKESSNAIRISQMEAAWFAFLENPMIGLGPKQFSSNVDDIKKKYELPYQKYVNGHAHNIFFETLANYGILGFLSLITWLFLWFLEIWRSSSLSKQLFLPLIIYIIVAGQVEMIFMAQTSTVIYFLYSLSFLPFFSQNPKVEK